MLNNYLKITFRNLWKNKQYSFINILGLSIGIAAVILILIYLRFEWSYDRFHENVDDIYRITVESNWEGHIENYYPFLAPVGPTLNNVFPQVQNFTRIRTQMSEYFYSENVPHRIDNIHHVDSTFFKLFSFKILSGDPDLALDAPYSIVLTRSTARDIWGTENVVGNTLQLNNKKTYTVTAVAEDPPINSTIDFDALISFSTLYQDANMFMDWDGGNQYVTYIQLHKNTDPDHFESLMEGFVAKYSGKSSTISYILSLESLKRIHLFYEPGFLFLRILQFFAIAVLILIMGSANFINITLVQSLKRTKETGVRKVLGAGKRQLIFQFLSESFITAMIAAIFGLALIEIIFPVYSEILGQDLPRSSLYSIYFVIGFFVISGFLGVIAGAIPAFYLASLTPTRILKNSFLSGHQKNRFRSTLLFVQFSISVLLIFSTLIIYQQQMFMKNKELGFNKNNVLVVNLPTDGLRAKNQIIKDVFDDFTFVHHASLNSEIPYRGLEANGYLPEGFSSYKSFHVIHTDEDFLETFDANLIEGRTFHVDMKTDQDACMINEALVNMLEWDDPVGKTIERNRIKHRVVGVVQDFHFASMHEKIEPLIIINSKYTGNLGRLALRVDNEAISSGLVIPKIREAISEIVPSAPFDYWFLDDVFNSLYRQEETMSQMFFYATILAIFIAFLGLYSLVSIETESRTKEIGIRKVLGSSVFGIIRLISKEFFIPVFISSLMAWPMAYYISNRWLQNFPYRIDLSIWPFLISGLTMICVAAITISLQAARSAAMNPVVSFRSE